MEEMERLRLEELEEDLSPGELLERAVEKATEQAEAEGEKVGQEVEGQNDFMTVLLEHAGGEVFLVEMAMTAACKAGDRIHSSKDGGDGRGDTRPGKMILSAKDSKVVICCHVPQSHHDNITADGWLEVVLNGCGGGQILRSAKDLATGVIKGDEKGCFRMPSGTIFSKSESAAHEATSISVEWLRNKHVFPQKIEEEDDFIPAW